MRVVAKIDAQGIFTEDVLIEDGAPVPSGCIDLRPPEGFHTPKWDGSQWEEGKPASEIFEEARAAKEAELRNAADAWYQANVRSFEGAVVTAKYGRGGLAALSAEERAVFDAMNQNYEKLKTLVGQARAATTLEELESIEWT